MKTAESNGTFEYDPNYHPSDSISNNVAAQGFQSISAGTIKSFDLEQDIESEKPSSSLPPAIKRKNSLDDFELEIEGINLDDNIDTSVSTPLLLF